ncbi:MAG: helix-turn-helix domain-containing protein, partial [Dolichospermum sp.]
IEYITNLTIMKNIMPVQNQPVEAIKPHFHVVDEQLSIKYLENLLKAQPSPPKLVAADGQEIPIPESVYQVLYQTVHALASGKIISVVIQDRELTTQKAADILKVSRPHLIKLLDQGEIPCIRVGTHRRVRFDDLMKYKEERDTKRREGIKQFTQFLEAEGFYDDESGELDQ